MQCYTYCKLKAVYGTRLAVHCALRVSQYRLYYTGGSKERSGIRCWSNVGQCSEVMCSAIMYSKVICSAELFSEVIFTAVHFTAGKCNR